MEERVMKELCMSLIATWFAVGCNGGSAVRVPKLDLPSGEDIVALDSRGRGTDPAADGVPSGDAVPTSDVPGIGGACQPGDGCFLDPCDENADCISSLCVTHMGDQVCTRECVEECPDGWTCQQVNVGPDVMFACISNFPFLCMPCHQDLDCTATWGGQAVCVDYGEVGRFCGGTCGDGEPCPDSFGCQEVAGTGGGTSLQCVPEAGECACSATSTKLGLSTTCSVANEFGTCEGLRICTEAGLTDCDAPTPAEEICDGVDNDCDGVVDGDALCDDDNPCTADSCGGEAGCLYETLEGLTCDDGTACTEGDFCQDGVCAGVAVSCDDGNPCTDDVCDPEGGCENPPNTDLCDDGDPCTVGDHCVDAACLGTPVPCDCDGADADCEVFEDGDVCNGTLFCDTGEVPFKCKVDPATVITCPEPQGLDAWCLTVQCDGKTGECSNVPANEGMACTDDDACTLGDACVAGFCTAQADLDCDDSNVCTAEFCHQVDGCVYEPTAEKCDDGNPCTDGDYCEGGLCVSLAVVDCDDGSVCTDDECNPFLGCVHENNVALCTDGDACTAVDHCKDGVCEPGDPVGCDDGNPCTDDSCDPVSGCVNAANTAACDDGNVCTSGDHCAGGACVPEDTVDCNDGNPCTDDLCKLDGGCQHLDNTAPCEDGDPCTTWDTCSAGDCVPGSGTLSCYDGDPCTQDVCTAQVGCEFPLIVPCCGNDQVDPGESCDDGNQAGGDGCSADCKSDETCGNGILDPATEICDSIHFTALCHEGTFVCESDCQSIDTSGCATWCGDGVIDPTYEACEPDLFYKACYEGEFQCLVDCKIWDKSTCMSWCGDGVANGPEDCDGMDFAVSCPLSQCWCSSDCVLYVDETEEEADWEDGDYDGVNNEPDDTVDPLCLDSDTLCLDATQSSLQHIWIANANHHEVVRINVDDGVVEKEVSSHGMYPSRTAVVVSDGSVWVGNRAYTGGANVNNPAHSNMVHLSKEGDLICRADILGNVRAVGIDQNGDAWAGSWEQHKAYKVSGTLVDEDQDPPRCEILGEVALDGCPYGAAGDSKGNMWFANNCNWASNYNPFIQSVERVDIETIQSTGAFVAPSSLSGCFNVYGMTVDGDGRILVGSYACMGMFRYTPDTDAWEWLSTGSTGRPRGVVVDQDGYIYSAISNHSGGENARHVIRVEPDFSAYQTLDLGSPLVHPVGVAIDRNGKLWTAGRNSDSCARVDIEDWGDNPAVAHYSTNGDDPYTYSDMTGFQHLLFTNPEGTWTQNYDGGADTIYWKSAEWTGIEEPGVTDLAVRARSAATEDGLELAGWTAWITDSPANLEGLPNLRWCQVQVRLQSNDSEKTPILTNLTVQWTK